MFTKVLATILLGVGITACQPSLVAEGKNTNHVPPVVQKQEPAQIVPPVVPETPATVVTGEVKEIPAKDQEAVSVDENVYIVQRGDNVTNIAKQYLPEGVTLNQMIASIYYHNEESFLYRNVNVVMVGARIKVPSKIRASAIDREDAYGLVYMHELEWRDLSYSMRQKNTPL